MTKYTEMVVYLSGETEKAYKFIFHEEMPEEEELWVPKSVIEDTAEPDKDNNMTISVAKWFLKSNDIPYEHEEERGY